jgi:hypothetical protein
MVDRLPTIYRLGKYRMNQNKMCDACYFEYHSIPIIVYDQKHRVQWAQSVGE